MDQAKKASRFVVTFFSKYGNGKAHCQRPYCRFPSDPSHRRANFSNSTWSETDASNNAAVPIRNDVARHAVARDGYGNGMGRTRTPGRRIARVRAAHRIGPVPGTRARAPCGSKRR